MTLAHYQLILDLCNLLLRVTALELIVLYMAWYIYDSIKNTLRQKYSPRDDPYSRYQKGRFYN